MPNMEDITVQKSNAERKSYVFVGAIYHAAAEVCSVGCRVPQKTNSLLSEQKKGVYLRFTSSYFTSFVFFSSANCASTVSARR